MRQTIIALSDSLDGKPLIWPTCRARHFETGHKYAVASRPTPSSPDCLRTNTCRDEPSFTKTDIFRQRHSHDRARLHWSVNRPCFTSSGLCSTPVLPVTTPTVLSENFDSREPGRNQSHRIRQLLLETPPDQVRISLHILIGCLVLPSRTLNDVGRPRQGRERRVIENYTWRCRVNAVRTRNQVDTGHGGKGQTVDAPVVNCLETAEMHHRIPPPLDYPIA